MGLLQPEYALRSKMIAESAITDVVSTRIYPAQAGYKATYPLVLYTRVDSEYFDTLNGLADKNLTRVSIQLDIFGKDYGTAKTAATAIRGVLHSFSGTITSGEDSLTITRIRHTDERDGFDNPSLGRPDGIYRVIQEYDIWLNNE